MSQHVKIQRLDPDVPMPKYQTSGAIGFDIATNEAGVIAPGETELFATGLVVCVPDGHGLILAPRSSNAKKGITMANSIGIIDQDYCGPDDELFLALHNLGNEPYEVEKYERLAQGIIVPVVRAEFTEEEKIESDNRGGFGTTG
jgi:dUTP pyrophosphatase